MCKSNIWACWQDSLPIKDNTPLQAGSSVLARPGYESRPSGEGRTARALMAPGPAPKGLIAVGYRLNISEVLQQEGMKVGAELGVQVGSYS